MTKGGREGSRIKSAYSAHFLQEREPPPQCFPCTWNIGSGGLWVCCLLTNKKSEAEKPDMCSYEMYMYIFSHSPYCAQSTLCILLRALALVQGPGKRKYKDVLKVSVFCFLSLARGVCSVVRYF